MMLQNGVLIFIIVLVFAFASLLICIITLLMTRAREKALEKELAERNNGECLTLDDVINSLEESFATLSETSDLIREKAEGIMSLNDKIQKEVVSLPASSEPFVCQYKDPGKP